MRPTNVTLELPIDETGEVSRYRISTMDPRWAYIVAIHLDATESASYQLEFGEVGPDGEVQWFGIPGDYIYTDTAAIHDSWQQSETYLRLVVTSAATAGATADVAVSRGR